MKAKITQFGIGLLWLAICAYGIAFWAFMWQYMPALWGLMDHASRLFVLFTLASVSALALVAYIFGERCKSDEIQP